MAPLLCIKLSFDMGLLPSLSGTNYNDWGNLRQVILGGPVVCTHAHRKIPRV